MVETLGWYLDDTMDWMRLNKLRLNSYKLEVLLVEYSLLVGSGCTPLLARFALIPKVSVHRLGVLLDQGLLLEDHVAAVARSAYYHLWLIHQLHPFLDKELSMPWSPPDLITVMCSTWGCA